MSRRKKPFPFFLWHRRLGLLAMLLVFILSVTGILLNHTEALKLDETSIESELLLDWYGINPKGEALSFNIITADDNKLPLKAWFSQWDQQLFFNGQAIMNHHEPFKGVAQLNDIYALALEHHVLLLDQEGEIIELMAFSNTREIQQIGISHQRFAILDTTGQFYLADQDISRWSHNKPQSANWSKAMPLNEEQVLQLRQSFRGEGINLERVILDLHSGRLFNASWGVYIMDISAILMILLGLSGLWIWWSRQHKMRQKKHYRKHH